MRQVRLDTGSVSAKNLSSRTQLEELLRRHVTELWARNFGLAIAYFIPGFVALWGVAEFSDPVHVWLTGSAAAGPTVGSVAYVLAASLTLGMTVSAVRWCLIDSVHHRTGIRPPRLDFARLHGRLEAFYAIVENHYRYYQFYANMAVATVFAGCTSVLASESLPMSAVFAALAVEAVFFAASRDALQKYYQRAALLLGERESEAYDDEWFPCRAESRGHEEAGAAGGGEARPAESTQETPVRRQNESVIGPPETAKPA